MTCTLANLVLRAILLLTPLHCDIELWGAQDEPRNLALVVGINYADAKAVMAAKLGALDNAENDAKSLKYVLEQHYGFKKDSEQAGGKDRGEVRDLVGSKATMEKIRFELSDPMGLLRMATDKDRVIVFFAGHGCNVRRNSQMTVEGVLFPHDIDLTDPDNPGNEISLEEVVAFLDKCKAKHKLLILDSCHSGEVFNAYSKITFAGRASSDARLDSPDLYRQRSFHVIASCQSSQLASDGKGLNSPFTQCLLSALRTLPLHLWLEQPKDRLTFGIHNLFGSMAPDLRTLHHQRPECRSAANYPGQFPFDAFNKHIFEKEYRGSLPTAKMLRAMVPGDSTAWWFYSRPWFIPSLRESILRPDTKAVDRNTLSSAAITEAELDMAAKNYVEMLEKSADASKGITPVEPSKSEKDPGASLKKFRLACFRMLRNGVPGKTTTDVIGDVREKFEKETNLKELKESVIRGLTEPTATSLIPLEAADLHLYALILHRSKSIPEAVERAYTVALSRYSFERERCHDTCSESVNTALTALCNLDYGFYFLDQRRSPDDAAAHFRQSREVFRLQKAATSIAHGDTPKVPSVQGTPLTNPMLNPALRPLMVWATKYGLHVVPPKSPHQIPAPFRVYSLCLEGNARQRMGRWGQADACFQSAVEVAENEVGVSHPLTASAFNQRAFNLLEQWNIQEAKKKFERSNLILKNLVTHRGTEYQAEILRLHNQHGLALVERLAGESPKAAKLYRRLSHELSENFAKLRLDTNPGPDAIEHKRRLIERMTNTLERQAECNLYGNPATRDSAEAFDDLRRLLRLSYLLPSQDQESAKPRFMFMQALALAADSPTRDLEMAFQILAEAERLAAVELLPRLGKAANPEVASTQSVMDRNGLTTSDLASLVAPEKGAIDKVQMWLVMYATVTRPTITLLQQAGMPSRGRERRGNDSALVRKAAKELREAIETFRVISQQDAQRDVLELFLFAAKVLVDHGPRDDGDRYHLLADSDLLLSLCRRALQSGTADAKGYLRPYYDAAIAAQLDAEPRQVKGILEAIWEATEGTRYRKTEQPRATLVVCEVNGCYHAFLDVPGGVSRHYMLNAYSPNEVKSRRGSLNPERLSLPDVLIADLERAARQQSKEGIIDVACWCGGMHRFKPELAAAYVSAFGFDTCSSLCALSVAVAHSPTNQKTFKIEPLPFNLPICVRDIHGEREDAKNRISPTAIPVGKETRP